MKIVLTGREAEEYPRLLDNARETGRLERRLEQLQALVTDGFAALVPTINHLLEVRMGQLADSISAQLDALAAQIDSARTTILSTVSAESAEDVQQNQALADKQAALDAANTEIQQLRDQLSGSMTAEEAAPIIERIAFLSGQVADAAAASKVTDPNAPSA